MEFKYVYSTSRVKTLSYKLLSENQLERLVGAKSIEEAFRVLQDTFLESFVYSKVASISEPMEKCLAQAKALLSSVAPDKKMINLLWIEFDFFNLKIITKGKMAGWSPEEIKAGSTFSGDYSFEALLKAYEEEKLGSLNIYFKQAVEESLVKKQDLNIDLIFDRNYLENLKEESDKLKDKFIKQFIKKIIDLFNLKTSLRLKYLREQGVLIEDIFIDGGEVNKKELENNSNTFVVTKKFGNGKKWKEAMEHYQNTGNFSLIEKASEEHLLNFLTSKGFDTFTPATLFSYFYRLKNNLHIIRTIILGKEMGLPELDIRKYLKKLY